MKIEEGKEYITRGGYKATVIYELSGNDKLFPFVICVKYSDGEEQAITVTRQGRKWEHQQSHDDLISEAPQKVKVERWLNVFPDGDFTTYDSKEEADGCATDWRFACKHLEFEVEEGEGL